MELSNLVPWLYMVATKAPSVKVVQGTRRTLQPEPGCHQTGDLKSFGSLRNGTLKRSIRNHLGEVIFLMASCHSLKQSNFVINNPVFDSFIFLHVYESVSF